MLNFLNKLSENDYIRILPEETKHINVLGLGNIKLYRIQAKRDFILHGDLIREGQKGGYVENVKFFNKPFWLESNDFILGEKEQDVLSDIFDPHHKRKILPIENSFIKNCKLYGYDRKNGIYFKNHKFSFKESLIDSCDFSYIKLGSSSNVVNIRKSILKESEFKLDSGVFSEFFEVTILLYSTEINKCLFELNGTSCNIENIARQNTGDPNTDDQKLVINNSKIISTKDHPNNIVRLAAFHGGKIENLSIFNPIFINIAATKLFLEDVMFKNNKKIEIFSDSINMTNAKIIGGDFLTKEDRVSTLNIINATLKDNYLETKNVLIKGVNLEKAHIVSESDMNIELKTERNEHFKLEYYKLNFYYALKESEYFTFNIYADNKLIKLEGVKNDILFQLNEIREDIKESILKILHA